MIKLVCFLHRKPGVSRETFHRHWEQVHGPLIREIPELTRHVVRYEQNARLESDYARDRTPGDAAGGQAGAAAIGGEEFDGATIMWFESVDAYDAYAREPLYASRIAVDEATFLDHSRMVYFLTHEAERKFGSAEEEARAEVKLLALLRRRGDVSIADFHDHWSGPHAKLFCETPDLRDQVLAYQQNHRPPADYARDPDTVYDGMAEQWYASLEAFAKGAGGGPFERIIAPDEESFLDRAATRFILCGPPRVVFARD